MNESENACLCKLLKANLIALAVVAILSLFTSSFWTSLKIVYVSAGIPIPTSYILSMTNSHISTGGDL